MRNFGKICLRKKKFAYKKFACAPRKILAWANDDPHAPALLERDSSAVSHSGLRFRRDRIAATFLRARRGP